MSYISRSLNIVLKFIALNMLLLGFISPSFSQNKNLAPSFNGLRTQANILLMPLDIELSEISLGGVIEPKAEWTDRAKSLIATKIKDRKNILGINFIDLVDDGQNEEVNDINALHAAIAQSIALHHFGTGLNALPTKGGSLDWSLGEVVKELKGNTAAEYALFFWVRDTYSSSERKVAAFAMALLGKSMQGGLQVAYSSLVDLKTGTVVWFNLIKKPEGDLRNPEGSAIALDDLLSNFPIAK